MTMLILMYLLDRIIMILILKIMTFDDGDSNDNIDKKNLSKKSKLLFMATVCILTFHGAGDR